jgi:hypothetical protein
MDQVQPWLAGSAQGSSPQRHRLSDRRTISGVAASRREGVADLPPLGLMKMLRLLVRQQFEREALANRIGLYEGDRR